MPAPAADLAAPKAILAAVKHGSASGVVFSADVLVRTLQQDYRWTDALIAELLRCLRQRARTKSA